jgi:hypothetical protein
MLAGSVKQIFAVYSPATTSAAEDAEGFVADTYLDITPVFDHWPEACAAFPMLRGETGFRYNDYYRSLAIARGCLSGFRYAVALMSPPEQLTRNVHAL